MNHMPDIRKVNAHAECDCGNNNSYDDGFVNCVIILVVTVSWVQYVYNKYLITKLADPGG